MRMVNGSALPTLLIPGLNCSARLYAPQIPSLWRLGPVTIADHTRAETIQGIAQSVLDAAPPMFRLVALSMGGYVAFEILRRAPARVAKLALLDTSARADQPEQSEHRRALIRLAEQGRMQEICDTLWPLCVHESRVSNRALRVIFDGMAAETGADAFIRQEVALIGRPDSRPGLAAIRCQTLVVVGDSDQIAPPQIAREIAATIPRARLDLIEKCGHLSTLEQPDVISRLLMDFFGSGAEQPT